MTSQSKIIAALLATSALTFGGYHALDAQAGPFHDHGYPEASNNAAQDAQTSDADGDPENGEDNDTSDEKWDVNNPPGDKTTIDINVTEGTWMSLDVSPDGRTIAFDLLGDIYTIPVTGGEATNISSGMAWEFQPRFSPDGSRIAFTSDRGGGDNIWTMNVDGSDPDQVTDESFRLLNNPTWHPNGNFIAARKHFTTSRSLGTGEIWLYHTSGGSGVQLVERPSESFQKELGEPMFSPDGKFVYYTQNTTPGNTFIYAQDSNTELFEIKRYEMDTGDIVSVAGGPGGAVRPTPSPDGKYLAYVKRVRAKSQLFIKDIESGEERMIFDHLDQDMQETWGVQGVYPNMDWSPDSESIFFWAGGQIHKLDIATDSIEHIDFEVNDTRDILTPPRPKVDVVSETFETMMPRYVEVSPNGRQVVFESLGKLYIRGVNSGNARRLTNLPDNIRELDPAWTPSGREVVFASWNDQDHGAIHKIGTGMKRIQTITSKPGLYRNPAVSPDGDYVAYEKGSGSSLIAPEWRDAPGLYIVPVDGGDPTHISKSGSQPHFAADDLRVYFTGNDGGDTALISTNLLGDDERVHAKNDMAQEFIVSPDGDTVAFRQNYNLYVMPILSGPQKISATAGGKALPVKKVSTNGSTYPSWSADGDTLYWSLGQNFHSANLDAVMAEDDDAVSDLADLVVSHEAAIYDGRYAITNARLITMTDDDGGVIDDGVIIVDGNRIEDIGSADDIELPSGIRTLDLSGKIIMPGLVDAHAHGPQGVGDLSPNQNWANIAHLALGVTTIFNPSTAADAFFPAADLQRAGKNLGPRLFSTGEVIYGAKAPGFFADIKNYDDAMEHVTRLDEQGAHGVKNYNQPRRDQRQQVTQAARERDILVVPEGGSLYHMDMSLVADGNSSIEHNLPVQEIYDDVVQMFSQTDVTYVPTIVVTYGGMSGETYFYQESDVWKHPLLSEHVPPAQLRARSVRRITAPEEDFVDDDAGAVSKKLADAGVKVTIGAHGQREGLASHWDMWSFARGGMSNVNVLKTGTVWPAQHLGFYDDIGSLEAGKLADMIVLDADPLEDIRNTDDIDKVVLGGRIYDAKTMNETFTGDAERDPYWWED